MNSYKLCLAIAVIVLSSACGEMVEAQKSSGSADSSSVSADSAARASDDASATDVSTDVSATNLPAPVTKADEDIDGDHFTGIYDCDEGNPLVNKGAKEECDGVDNNCDGHTDEDVTEPRYLDADKDGYGVSADPIQICKGEPTPKGYALKNGDCNDSASIKSGKVVGFFVNPGAKEECDGVDNNCDGVTDDASCPKREKGVSDPVVTPPADPTSVTGEIGIVVIFADEATRTMSAQEYYSEVEIGKWWTVESMIFHTKVVSIGVSSKDALGVRFNIATGEPATSWLCDLNSTPAIDKKVTMYKVIPATNLWIDVTKEVVMWPAPEGKGCSAKLPLKK